MYNERGLFIVKKNRVELETTVYIVIEEHLQDRRKIREYIIKRLEQHNISAGKVMAIFNQNESIPIQTLPNAELYLFTNALYEIAKSERINPEKWFNDEEIKLYSEYKAETFFKGNIVVFSNVDQVSDNQWICSKATYQEMSNIMSQGLFTYNIRTQRESTTIRFNDIATEIPTIKQVPVIEMTNLMLSGKFTPNTIALNIRHIGIEKYEYSPKARTLSVQVDNDSTFIDIIDGMHRTLAMMRAVETNPNISLFTAINILNFTEEQAQAFIDQEDHRTPINKTFIASFRNDDNGVKMAKDINVYGNKENNALFNMFATQKLELKAPYSKYVTIENFAAGFNHNFTISEPRDFTKIQGYLIKFFNEIVGLLKEIGKDEYISNNYFIGYLAWASVLYADDNWIDKINDIIKDFDFSNDKLNEIISVKKIKPANVTKISDYFKQRVGIENV